jgi:hypothetical protein
MLAYRSMQAAIVGLSIVVAVPTAAQTTSQGPSDEVVVKMREFALKNIHRALCEANRPCAPATPAEIADPPISIEQARTAVLTGSGTALADWCGLDGQRRNLLPMTRHLRQVLRFNERQVSLMVLIHGIQHGVVSEQLKARGACDGATRERLDAQLPKT